MKLKERTLIKTLSLMVIIFLCLNINTFAEVVPVSIIITTEGKIINTVTYGRYEIRAEKIVSQDKKSLGYCLEIEKEYPSGEKFNLTYDMEDQVLGILKAGYPDHTPEELGLANEDEAYFATQVALWCYLEKYNVEALDGDARIIKAIKEIYNGSDKTRSLSDYEIKTYYTAAEVQDIIMLLRKEIEVSPTEEEKVEENTNNTENNEEIILGK